MEVFLCGVQRTDIELDHRGQCQSPEAQYQQNHWACGELMCFKSGCCYKEATNSKCERLTRTFSSKDLSLQSQSGHPRLVSPSIWTNVKYDHNLLVLSYSVQYRPVKCFLQNIILYCISHLRDSLSNWPINSWVMARSLICEVLCLTTKFWSVYPWVRMEISSRWNKKPQKVNMEMIIYIYI